MAKMNRVGRWFVNRRTESRARRALKRLGANLEVPPTSFVLELGSGGGGMVALLHERYHPAHIVGTDFDPDQVAAASQFLTARWGSLPTTVELRPADALALPFSDASFDVLFGMMMLHHVEERPTQYVQRPKALKEVRRVLRPGGTFVYSEMFARAEIRQTLTELGFVQKFLRKGFRHDLAVYRTPG